MLRMWGVEALLDMAMPHMAVAMCGGFAETWVDMGKKVE